MLKLAQVIDGISKILTEVYGEPIKPYIKKELLEDVTPSEEEEEEVPKITEEQHIEDNEAVFMSLEDKAEEMLSEPEPQVQEPLQTPLQSLEEVSEQMLSSQPQQEQRPLENITDQQRIQELEAKLREASIQRGIQASDGFNFQQLNLGGK